MKVSELEEMKLVGLRVICEGDRYVIEIPKASINLKDRLNEIKGILTPARLVGAYVVGDYSDDEDGYWVCIEVKEHDEVPDGMVAITIPPQRYAVIRHEGPNSEIRNTYEKLHRWIEENGIERIHRAWHLEISDVWGNREQNEVEVDLYDTIK